MKISLNLCFSYINLIYNILLSLFFIFTASLCIRVGSDIRWPDIDYCRVSGFLRNRYPVSGHFAGLPGRIFDYFEQKLKIYPYRQLLVCPFIFYLTKMALESRLLQKKTVIKTQKSPPNF